MEVTVEGLGKVYGRGVEALSDVNLRIPAGMFGLLGPNGAGKTTLMRILAGILRPTSGTTRVAGHDLSTKEGRAALKGVLGYLPQDLGLYPDLTAREFLDYVGILKGMQNRRTRCARIEELLETVGLSEAANRKLRGFSGGMKRRVGIAQALLNDPRLLIVDEPTAGLDPEERVRFRNLLSGLGGERVVLLSTHIVEDVAQTSSRLAVLARGRTLFAGTTAGLIEEAQGKVFEIETEGEEPEGPFTVISTLRLGGCTRYRAVGEAPDRLEVREVPPSLEDGYVWLMRKERVPAGAA